VLYLYFFFQAEDGIRDDLVTGVQTCALPIFRSLHSRRAVLTDCWVKRGLKPSKMPAQLKHDCAISLPREEAAAGQSQKGGQRPEIGRASCRERVKTTVLDGALK